MKKLLVITGLASIMLISLFACKDYMDENLTDRDGQQEELSETGLYHNEILKNYIYIQNQKTVSTRNEDQITTYKNMVADYGCSVYLAYKNNPPVNQSIDSWVNQILGVSFSSQGSSICNCILNKDMTIVQSLNYTYGSGNVPTVIASYLNEIETLLSNGFSNNSIYKSKLTQLHLKYYRQASSEDRSCISNITDVAQGSFDYWQKEAKVWNYNMNDNTTAKVKKVAKKLVAADISGVVEYFISRRLGIIGALSWKGIAAIAAVNSMVAGVDMLFENWSLQKAISTRSISISKEELYDAYLKRKQELNIE